MIKIYKDGLKFREEIFTVKTEKPNVTAIVEDIIANVVNNGDKALYDYAEKFDKVKLNSLKVTEDEILSAYNSVPKEFIDILQKAKKTCIIPLFIPYHCYKDTKISLFDIFFPIFFLLFYFFTNRTKFKSNYLYLFITIQQTNVNNFQTMYHRINRQMW